MKGEPIMNGTYNLNELAMMTRFTTRTLRNYLKQGLFSGEKADGIWRFTTEDVEKFFSEPFVKEGMRIKRSNVVLDFMADRTKKTARMCVVLDMPADLVKGNRISAFFCEQMQEASDTEFTFDLNNGSARVILAGAQEQVMKIMKAYSETSLGA